MNKISYKGIKDVLPFISIRKVPMEVLKPDRDARGLNTFRGALRMSINVKIMFDQATVNA